MNRENLQRLATFLAYERPEEVRFTMGIFSDNPEDDAVSCGTAGCAAGHGTLAGIEKLPNEDWYKYSCRAFAVGTAALRDEWDWCFGSSWVAYDNSPVGAAKRIQYLLDPDTPPESWLNTNDPGGYADAVELYEDVEVKR